MTTEHSTVVTSSTQIAASQASPEADRAHCRGPLDGSLYAKVNKNKKSEDVDTNHVTEEPPQESTNPNLEEQISLTNHTSEEEESTNQKPPNVIVVNGNRIIYKPPPELDFDPQTISAPLATLTEFNGSYLSITSSGESAPSLSSVAVTSSPTTIKSVPLVDVVNNSGNMADGSIQQTAVRIVDDVMKKSALTKVGNDVTKLNARYSEISSCSATTLSSTTTEEGGAPQAELSDHDTSSESSLSDLDGNLSPSTVKGNISPEIFLEQALGDTEESEPPLFVEIEAEKTEIKQPVSQIVPSFKETSVETLPPPAVPPPAVPTNPSGSPTQEVMYNGINGSYNKGPEYAVPMRDMKITTIPSKRAVLVSTGNDDMAAQTSERRDSVYDDGNAYSGGGYSAIEEYPGAQSIQTKTPSNDEHSYIPEDVQELLNGLQEGTTSSDIDSGFHGSSMALPQSKSPQSSSEFSDPFGSPPPSQSNGLSPTFDECYPMGKMTSPTATTVQHASVATNHNYQTSAVSDLNVQGVATTTPTKKNLNPGVPIPTQTAPEPQPAKVQIITMRNVYKNSEGIPLYPKEEVNSVSYATKQHTQPGPVEYKYHQEATKTSPAVATDNYMETVTMRTKTAPVETVTMRTKKESATSPIKSAATPETFDMRNNHVAMTNVAMTTGDATMELYYDDEIEDELDTENIKSVEEQISHAQEHLLFLKEQQEKLVKRKQDRTKYREKRNSSVFDRTSQGYNMSPVVSATMPRQPYRPAEEVPPPVAVKSQTLQRNMAPVLPQHIDNKMPPIGNINQRVVAAPVQQQQAPPPTQNAWNAGGPKLSRQASDASHDRNGPVVVQPSLPEKKSTQPIRGQSKADIIISDDLQEQLAELDRCIAELTMDIPSLAPEPQKAEEPAVVLRQRSYTLDAARKMETNVPQTNSNGGTPVPNPPTRSRSSFDSYKRLSQDFDLNKLKSPTDQGGNDDVFSPGPQVPRKKKQQSQFPPQTSVTRRQNVAPAPPPKRRISIEERLSPELFQALALNPGAKPKENIHSYKEDLAPENPPDTPTFPLSPATPYTNNDSPSPVPPAGQVKSPVVFMKTPLSALHLQPTDKPMKSLHHVESPASPPQEDVVDGKMPTPNGKQSPIIEPAIQAAVALQNGHAKETALLSDESETSPKPEPVAPQQTEKIVQPQNIPNGQNHIARPAVNNMMAVKVAEVQRESPVQQQTPTPPSNLDLPQTNNYTPTNLHGTRQQIQNQQQPTTPQQNLLNHSGTPQSCHSHSSVATSSNSRHGSSDSLDGPSTRHSNSSVLSSSSSSSAHVLHPGMGMMTPNNVMRPGSQLSNYDRHLLPPGSASGHRSGDESFGSPQSGRTSSSSISDVEKMNYDVSHATISAAPKFIRDTTAYWYKPDIAREQALAILRSKPAGSFVVRDSRCFPGAFGLALKVDKLPPNVQSKPGADIANEYVRHFLIEPSSRGVKLKGCPNEPVFGSLSALVYQHSITALALPCRLIIPTADQEIPQPGNTPRQSPAAETPPPVAAASPANAAVELLKQGAACNVIYLGTVDTESLTGPPAIERAIRETFQNAKTNPNMTSIVHFKVSPQGITLTDNARKLFFRRHYSTDTVTFCGLDPLGGANKAKPRRWDASNMRGGPEAWLFGFVARKQAGSRDNACHVFAELDSAQPARAIVNFVMKVLIGSTRQNSS